jgi:hypothetical protein
MTHCSASLRSPRDLIICTDPQPDTFRTNPGSHSLFVVNKVAQGSKVVYFWCTRGRSKIVWGPSFGPTDSKIRANDAQGSNYSEYNFSDPLATPLHLVILGDSDQNAEKSRSPSQDQRGAARGARARLEVLLRVASPPYPQV